MIKFNQLAEKDEEKKKLKIFFSSIKTKVAIKFPNLFIYFILFIYFFFPAENWLGAGRVRFVCRLYENLVSAQNIDPFPLFTGQETRNFVLQLLGHIGSE